MAKARGMAGVVACLGLLTSVTSAWAGRAPTVAEMLAFSKPQHEVNYSTPSEQDQAACKVELVSGTRPKSSGWLLRDPRGLPLRRFFDVNGDGHVDIWSYYQDGVEVYREMSTSFDGKADQFRWMNTGGMKWGVDTEHDGRIHYWKMISPEEVSQETFQALIHHDFARLQALWINDAEIRSLDLSQSEINRIHMLQQQAATKFENTVARLQLTPQARWERLESAGPQCVLGEQLGMKHDTIKYPRSTILFENNGKHDWIQMGEMIQVGLAWRLVDAPMPGNTVDSDGNATHVDPALQALLDELRQLDAQAPKAPETPGPNPALVSYNLKRAGLIQRILGKARPDEREQWIHQYADCLSGAAQASPESDKSAYQSLVQLCTEIEKEQPGSPLAGYIKFRVLSAEYAPKLASGNSKDFAKVQEQWVERLAKFVQDYPRAEDTPDALLQLAMVSEFLGKEAESKKWYQQLAANFPDKKQLADKAEGALRRLDLEGKPFELVGTTFDGKPFNIASERGRVVVVYYWASWIQQSIGDFARLKLLLNTYGPKGFDIVCVNLDNSPPEANGSIDRSSLPGTQLFDAHGLDGALATQYGIVVLPNMFLVNKDGAVANRNVQLSNLEDELKKLLK